MTTEERQIKGLTRPQAVMQPSRDVSKDAMARLLQSGSVSVTEPEMNAATHVAGEGAGEADGTARDTRSLRQRIVASWPLAFILAGLAGSIVWTVVLLWGVLRLLSWLLN